MKPLLLTSFQRLLNDPKLTRLELLQALWSGYGEISRFDHPKLNTSVIIKAVKPPQQVNHPRGWHSDVGHTRKLISYQVEANFYQHFALKCDEHCYVPRFIAYDISPDVNKLKPENKTARDCLTPNYEEQVLVIEDLQAAGFNDDVNELSLDDIDAVIYWLAFFHARFMGETPTQLWPIGTYWHLATRQDEYKVMASGVLKQSAVAIDEALNNAHYKTLVHGDAKLANFCFGDFNTGDVNESDFKSKADDDIESHDVEGSPLLAQKLEKRVAAVDFQYVGSGVGVKDLAYFLGSCLCDDDLKALHIALCDKYFIYLQQGLKHYQQDVDFSALEKEWRKLYALSCADFHRFLQGWSPEHPKINTYLEEQTDIALAALQ